MYVEELTVDSPVIVGMRCLLIQDANICPSGGIDHDNASEWLEAGATAVGMGSCLAGRDIKIRDASSEQFQTAVESWNSVEKPAAADLALRLGLN